MNLFGTEPEPPHYNLGIFIECPICTDRDWPPMLRGGIYGIRCLTCAPPGRAGLDYYGKDIRLPSRLRDHHNKSHNRIGNCLSAGHRHLIAILAHDLEEPELSAVERRIIKTKKLEGGVWLANVIQYDDKPRPQRARECWTCGGDWYHDSGCDDCGAGQCYVCGDRFTSEDGCHDTYCRNAYY